MTRGESGQWDQDEGKRDDGTGEVVVNGKLCSVHESSRSWPRPENLGKLAYIYMHAGHNLYITTVSKEASASQG